MLRQQAGVARARFRAPGRRDDRRCVAADRERVARARAATRPRPLRAQPRVRRADEPLHDGDELALIPPVAGGSDSYTRLEDLTWPDNRRPPCRLHHEVPTNADGAYVVFLGRTRESAGSTVAGGGDEAEARRQAGRRRSSTRSSTRWRSSVLRAIASEIEQRFGVTRLAIVHRSGEVPLGEASVVVAAASAHRECRVRRRALRHRGAQGARADLEERAVRRRIGVAWCATTQGTRSGSA